MIFTLLICTTFCWGDLQYINEKDELDGLEKLFIKFIIPYYFVIKGNKYLSIIFASFIGYLVFNFCIMLLPLLRVIYVYEIINNKQEKI